MKSLLSVFSYLCGLIAAIVTFVIIFELFEYVNKLAHGHARILWKVLGAGGGLILGIIVSDIVKNLIHKEPTRF